MRRFLLASVAALAVVSAAPLAGAQTLKVVMHSDLKVLDPIWSGAYIVRNHGYMLYDTLFAMDEQFQIKPQMVDTWSVSVTGLSGPSSCATASNGTTARRSRRRTASPR